MDSQEVATDCIHGQACEVFIGVGNDLFEITSIRRQTVLGETALVIGVGAPVREGKLYRIVAPNRPYHGVEFEVPEGSDEDEITKAGFEAVAEYVSFGWESVRDAEEES